MTDPFYSVTEEVRAAGLRPRRFRSATKAVRQLGWLVVRGWLYTLVKHINWENRQITSTFEAALMSLEDEVRRLHVECAFLREQAEAEKLHAAAKLEDEGVDRRAMDAIRLQVETLQTTLAQVAIDRSVDRRLVDAIRLQVETLQTTLAHFTIDRAFFESDIRTEIMAVTNIVDHYRDLTEKVLEDQWVQKHAVTDQAVPYFPSSDSEDGKRSPEPTLRAATL